MRNPSCDLTGYAYIIRRQAPGFLPYVANKCKKPPCIVSLFVIFFPSCYSWRYLKLNIQGGNTIEDRGRRRSATSIPKRIRRHRGQPLPRGDRRRHGQSLHQGPISAGLMSITATPGSLCALTKLHPLSRKADLFLHKQNAKTETSAKHRYYQLILFYWRAIKYPV